MNLPRQDGRICGGCKLCCKAVAVQTLNKPTGAWCQHTSDIGCAIYEQRWDDPSFHECRGFRCLWLQGFFNEQDRPDKSKAVFYAVPDPQDQTRMLAVLNEAHPGAVAGSARIDQILRMLLAQGIMVLLRNADYAVAYHPNGQVLRQPIDSNDPLRVAFNASIAPTRITVRGKLV